MCGKTYIYKEGNVKPKIAVWTGAVHDLSVDDKRLVAKADLIVAPLNPDEIASLKAVADHPFRILWNTQPQYVYRGPVPDWAALSLSWSIDRIFQKACYENNWYLKDVAGNAMSDGGNTNYVNWTPYCPLGRYGDAMGMKAADYYIRKLGELALSGNFWRPWRWDSFDTINGFDFEILVDCVGSLDSDHRLRNACPRYDLGIRAAEGVSTACSIGGMVEPLSRYMKLTNLAFVAKLKQTFPTNFMWLINGGDNLSCADYMSGIKYEDFGRRNKAWVDWMWGSRGYMVADSYCAKGRTLSPGAYGTARSVVRVDYDVNQTHEANLRRMRFGLGSALLGDGYFGWSRDERMPLWDPLFDLDLGEPMGRCEKIAFGSSGAVYRRYYKRCTVTVNPSDVQLADYPPQDTTFER
jgi:hypothetical protein